MPSSCPGGFSYGDYLRCGAIARFSPVMETIIDRAGSGLPVLGICNGFQVLCESHLLPGALTRNDHLHFVCRDQRLRIENVSSAWTGAYEQGEEIVIPIKNGEGRYVADAETLARLEGDGLVVARYSGDNPNGSVNDIAGIVNEAGNVVGLMPHPEHAVDPLTGPSADGLGFFASVLKRLAGLSRSGTVIDTVVHAGETPDVVQPYADLGLADDEYARIRQILGRRPTSCELAMYSVMWSEHCSYKSSKVHLRQFATMAPPSDALLVGIGENAGVVDIGQGYAATFKIESHNHPSFVEPYQGAATGVGGIVRDILTMGARPVAVLDPLRFGPADAADTRRVLPGVVAGIGGYANCLGLPTIGGEVVFDPSYSGNPLVNALCVGVLRRDAIKLARASGPGNKVILYGAKTGRDGIGGVSVLASASFDSTAGESAKKPSVQVGDPFLEKVLIECSLELFERDLVVGIQDLGGAGLSCATTELASAGSGGMRIELDRVPLREASMQPAEVLTSESQERMCAVVAPGDVEEFLAVCEKWEVDAAVIGEVTEVGPEEAARGGSLVVTWHGEVVVDVPPRTVAHEGPVYERPYARPAVQDLLQADVPDRLSRPSTEAELRSTLLQLAGSPNLCSKGVGHRAVRQVRTRQYRARPARRRGGHQGRRVHRPRCCPGDRRQRAVHPARSVCRRPARAGRGLPQRRGERRTPARRDELPQLRLTRGSRGHVAVRRGSTWARRRLPRPRPSGDRRERLVLQPDC